MGSFGMGILLAHHQTKSHHRHAETSADIISTETANHILVVWVSQILSCHVWCGAAAAGGGVIFLRANFSHLANCDFCAPHPMSLPPSHERKGHRAKLISLILVA